MGVAKSICKFLGKANLPVYTVVTVALFKGILRPTFTMMDKKQDPETKKYAAIREGATELTALITYPLLSIATGWLAPAFSPEGKNYEQLLKNSRSTLGFFGVCFAALFAIPKLCNIAMPHIMKALKIEKPKNDDKHSSEPFPTETLFKTGQNQQVYKSIQSPYAKTPMNTGGGLRV